MESFIYEILRNENPGFEFNSIILISFRIMEYEPLYDTYNAIRGNEFDEM